MNRLKPHRRTLVLRLLLEGGSIRSLRVTPAIAAGISVSSWDLDRLIPDPKS